MRILLLLLSFIFCVFAICPKPVLKFNCPATHPLRPAVSAHHLHPSDIKIVAAMGDSITAGLFMRMWKNPFTIRVEHRGFGYSNGALIDSIYSNIEKYQKSVKGGVNGPTAIFSYSGGGSSGYNFAVTAAGVQKLNSQIDQFILKLTQHNRRTSTIWRRVWSWFTRWFHSPPKDYQSHWKMVNIWIGAIDLCQMHSAEYFSRYLKSGLERLRRYSKHTLVNLVLHPDLSQVYDITRNNRWCLSVQKVMKMCPPLFEDGLVKERNTIKQLIGEYNKVMITIAEHYAQLNDPEFAVLAQGGLVNVRMNQYRVQDILSLADCFHPNKCTNQNFAYNIWNSLYTPVEQDPFSAELPGRQWHCPTSQDYFQ